jgi:hypothetical protein
VTKIEQVDYNCEDTHKAAIQTRTTKMRNNTVTVTTTTTSSIPADDVTTSTAASILLILTEVAIQHIHTRQRQQSLE